MWNLLSLLSTANSLNSAIGFVYKHMKRLIKFILRKVFPTVERFKIDEKS
jgi:hypothetical protein